MVFNRFDGTGKPLPGFKTVVSTTPGVKEKDLHINRSIAMDNLADGQIAVAWNDATEGTVMARLLEPSPMGKVVFGTPYAERLTGSGGNDVLYGKAGDDKLIGLEADDLLVGGAGADLIDGGFGTDTASYVDAATGVTADLSAITANKGDAVGDEYTGVENLTGSRFNDILYGDANANVLSGGSGSDSLDGRGGNDTLEVFTGSDTAIGGSGTDMVSYRGLDGPIVFDLANPSLNTGEAKARETKAGGPGDWFESIEGVGGTKGPDHLSGDAGPNKLYGYGGDDVLEGRAGNDILNGGSGKDRLIGGSGADDYRFSAPYKSFDTIVGFNPGTNGPWDQIWIATTGFLKTDGTPAFAKGPLPPSAFVAGAVPRPTAKVPTLLYDTDTGMLVYDRDGTGSAKGIPFVKLEAAVGVPDIDAQHIGVY